MTKVIYVTADGEKTTIEANEGDTIMQVAIASGIEGIVGECCGSMMCATCHVYVQEPFLGRLAERSEGEDEMLECAVSERRPQSRLSCQIKLAPHIDGIEVHLPEEQ